MKPFASASLAEAGVFAIRQTLRRIIREFEDDPNTAVRQTIDAETKKRAIDVDLIADREFATQFRHYDGGRYAGVVVTGEERPGDSDSVDGPFGTYVLLDALDGSDLAERGLANWCSAVVFFEVARSTAKIRAAVVGMPPNHVYFATDDDPRVRVYRNLPDLEGQILANLTLEPEEVTGLPPERALCDASLYFYGQKIARLFEIARRPLLTEVGNEEFGNLRIYNLGGIPMLVRMCDHQVKRARGVDAVFELSGQRPYDVVPGSSSLSSWAQPFSICPLPSRLPSKSPIWSGLCHDRKEFSCSIWLRRMIDWLMSYSLSFGDQISKFSSCRTKGLDCPIV